MTNSNQFEILLKEHIVQNYSYTHDIYPELKKCNNHDIQKFCNRCEIEDINYKRDPTFIIDIIKEDFSSTIDYYKIQLFLSQLYKDIADGIIFNETKKNTYEKFSRTFFEKSKETEKDCKDVSYISYQIENNETEKNIIQCEKNYLKYNEPNFLLMKGNFESRKNIEDAINTFSDGIKIYPNDARFYNNLGNMYLAIEEFDTSNNYFQNIVKNTDMQKTIDNLDIFWNNLGCMYTLIGDVDNANMYLNKAIKKNRKNFRAWYNAGVFNSSRGNEKISLKCFKTAYLQNKTHPKTGIQYALELMKSYNTTDALSVFKSISKFPHINKMQLEHVRMIIEKVKNHDDLSVSSDKELLTLKKIASDIANLFNLQNSKFHSVDVELFQKIVTAMQSQNTTIAKTSSNELADVRKIRKLSESIEYTFRYKVIPNMLPSVIIVKDIRKTIILQKIISDLIFNLNDKQFKNNVLMTSLKTLEKNIITCFKNMQLNSLNFENNIDADKSIREKEIKQIWLMTFDREKLIDNAKMELNKNENNVEALETLSFAYFDLNQFDKASKFARKIPNIEPNNFYSAIGTVDHNHWVNFLTMHKANDDLIMKSIEIMSHNFNFDEFQEDQISTNVLGKKFKLDVL